MKQKIPKLMHCIRVGDLPPPTKRLNTRKEKHPKREYKLRGNKELKETKRINQNAIDYYISQKLWNGVADCMRYEILYKYGGVLHGADRECINPIDDLFKDGEEAYQIDTSHYGGTDREVDQSKIGCAMPLFACIPGFKGVRKLIQLISRKTSYGSPALTTGNRLMGVLNNKYHYNIKTIPMHQFIPEHFNGRKYTGTDKIYSKHYRGSTRGTYNQGI